MILALNILFGTSVVRAVEVILLPVANEAVNLSVVGERYESQDPNLQIRIGDGEGAEREELAVSALNQRAPYRWLTFSLANETDAVVKPLIVVPKRGFAGTGFIWPLIGGNTVLSIIASSGAEPEPVFGRPGVYRLSVEPKQTVTYVVEISGNWPPRLGLWNERAYEFHIQNRALFRGFLLGLIGLIALYFTVLFFVSRQTTYLSGALLSIAGTALLLSEFGYVPQVLFGSPDMAIKIRAATEAMMALGVFSCFHTLLLLRHRLPFFGYLNLILLFCLAGLVAYAFYQPFFAAGLARISFGSGVGFGGLIILYLSARGNPKALALLPAWITLIGWTLFTGSAIQGVISHPLLSPGIASGLILVLLLLAFVVTQFALGNRVAGEGSGRKTLALAGAGHSVWDYNLEEKSFFVSPEIEKLLGLRPGHFQLGGTHTWLDLMHKEDRPNFTNRLDATVKEGVGRLNLSFRMRGTDGKYRWLKLRARAMPGENKRASRCIGIVADITHDKLAEDRLLRDAVHDHLTGLPNQALFLDRLERALNRHSEEDSFEIGLILVDIDRFNNINDSFGYAAGDSFLLISARRIQEHLSPSDTVARISENRFAILIASQTDSDEIRNIAEKIQKSISEPIPFKPEEIYLTTNIGMAVYKSEKDGATEFLKKAEIAMYSAKRHGRNNLSVFDPRMARRTTNRVALESDLRRAVERNEFKLVFQPIIRLADGKIAGFEALVRWQHKNRGLLGPDEFMDIAEETDLIVDIGRFVLNEAGMQLGSWQRLFTFSDPLFMSVNVSTRQINQPDLMDDLRSILDRAEIKPGTLKIEVTETQVMENPELASRVLKRIRKIGAGLSLDDFGTGYSSLSYLQSFPFDTIKIDKSFVHSENGDQTSDVILKSVVSLAHDLGMQVVAEGAEKIEEVAILKEIGCEFVQGFLFGEPMSARDAQKFLSNKPSPAEKTQTDSVFAKLAKFTPKGKQPQTAKPTDAKFEDTDPELPKELESELEELTKEETVSREITPEENVKDEKSASPPSRDVEDAPEALRAKGDESQSTHQDTGNVEGDKKDEKNQPEKSGEDATPDAAPKAEAKAEAKVVEPSPDKPEKMTARSKAKTNQPSRLKRVSAKNAGNSASNKGKKSDPRRKFGKKKKKLKRRLGKKNS